MIIFSFLKKEQTTHGSTCKSLVCRLMQEDCEFEASLDNIAVAHFLKKHPNVLQLFREIIIIYFREIF